MDSYDKEVIFHLPGLFYFWTGYQALFSLIEQNPKI